MNEKRRFLAGLSAALAAALAASAEAQIGGGFPGGGTGRRGGRGGGSRSSGDQKSAPPKEETGVNRFEATVEELRQDLNLAPEQRPAWETCVGKVRALADDVSRERARQRTASAAELNAVQRVEREVDAARNRLAALEEIADSAKALYAGLSPEQRKVADARLANLVGLAATSSRPF